MSRKRHPPAGAQPGTLVINGRSIKPVIHVMKYRADHLEEHDAVDAEAAEGLLADDSVCWIDVQGLGDEGVLRNFAERFEIHPLALEDVVNTPQRPKVEHYAEHLLCITRILYLRAPDDMETEQVSLFVGKNYVLSFQEFPGDVFDPVRARLRQGGPVFRSAGPGYLAYALLDAVIDGYFPIMETFGEYLEKLESKVTANPRRAVLRKIHRVKRELLALRRTLWPQREAFNSLIRDASPFIDETARLHLRDCYDHCVQMMDMVETYRELAAGLTDLYLSSVGNRQNEIMKVLTIVATIFIPLTFLAGIYGMNFEYMPELRAVWGYPALLLAMALAAGGMLLYFRRKGWLGGG